MRGEGQALSIEGVTWAQRILYLDVYLRLLLNFALATASFPIILSALSLELEDQSHFAVIESFMNTQYSVLRSHPGLRGVRVIDRA